MQHRPASPGGRQGADTRYTELSRKPLHVLAYLAPLLLAYEIGSAAYLSRGDGATETIRAQSILVGFFQDFGVAGRFLPGLVIVVVLAAWHVISGDRTRLRLWVLPIMALESFAWTIPLLVILALVGGDATRSAGAALASGAPDLDALSWQAKIAVSIGAGLYEELLFRMLGIAAVHTILVDLLHLRDRVGVVAGVGLAALAFAAYHDPIGSDGSVQWVRAAQLSIAGAYFGGIYLSRGFGIVVTVHALYDIFVLVVLRPGHGG